MSAAGPAGQAGAAFTLDDLRYVEQPAQDRTDWTASLGGSYNLGHDTLTLGYAHLSEYEIATELGSVQSTTAIPTSPTTCAPTMPCGSGASS